MNVERSLAGRRRGFTLVELLIVISIIVILIAMIGLVFPRFQEELNITKCQNNLRAIHGILMTYAAANDGWFPPFDGYWGTNISHTYKYDDGRIPEVTPWEAMSDVAQLKDMGASPDVFFCPFHPHYGDYEYWQIKSWEEPQNLRSDWNSYNYARVDFGYFFFINRGGRWGGNPAHWLSDGRRPIRKDTAGEDNLPIVADLLHYRNEELKSGWWHGGGPGADEGLFNSSCNTLFFGGYVIYKEWPELEKQGYATTSTSSDFRWFWLGSEVEEY
ncbi:MAG: prepilin-type N-terminal cleavage/methylation domain-containing protein [Anaerolineaceae bacterium]|nr:prepilin-type N-terminal cleavage/methylation domain-containing protein [Anaerolineaceae bacterium]